MCTLKRGRVVPPLAVSPRGRLSRIADLLRATLRRRPDRIIVGEERGAEAFELLQALNTERLGSMTTIHALPLSRRSHDSRTTVSTRGQLGCHMEASERRSRSQSIWERRRQHHRCDVGGIDCDDGSFVRLPFSGGIQLTK
jgi:hypothetical protein